MVYPFLNTGYKIEMHHAVGISFRDENWCGSNFEKCCLLFVVIFIFVFQNVLWAMAIQYLIHCVLKTFPIYFVVKILFLQKAKVL